MKLSGYYQINQNKQKVWEALNDPEILKKSIPGCEEFKRNSDTNFTAIATNKIGPFNATFTGDIELKEIKAPDSYVIEGSGNSPVGFASGNAKVKLEESDGGTKLIYEVEANVGGKIAQVGSRLIDMTAKKMADNDIEIDKTMGKCGAELFENNDTIMTHCNAGALATVAYGTALGVIRATKESGKNIKVIATETRPVQQGSRLTAFELKHDGFDVSLIPDTAVGYSMTNGLVDKVVVGADRIVRTGHVFNKIGTYQVATMAKQHGIPFYVAAPLSTFDMKTDAKDVIIEMRKGTEVTGIGEKKTAPDGINVINPAFDMTPPELISGIITEKGVAKSPFTESIKKLFEAN